MQRGGNHYSMRLSRNINTTLRSSFPTVQNTDCLRALPTKMLRHLNQAVENASYPSPGVGYGVYDFGPVVDGTFIPMLPGLAFQLGNFYDVPLLVDHDA